MKNLLLLILLFVINSSNSQTFNRDEFYRELSNQQTICLRSSQTLEKIVNSKNLGLMNESQSMNLFMNSESTMFPDNQKRRLSGMVIIIFGKESNERLNPKQVGIDYFLNCMNSFSK